MCGGEATEPAYFEGLKGFERNPAVTVKVIGSGAAPADVVAEATRRRSAAPDDFDEVWCVVDVDDFKLNAAEQRANADDVTGPNPSTGVWRLVEKIAKESV